MLPILQCITQSYDLRLAPVALGVCGAASLAAFSLYPRSLGKRPGSSAAVWITLAALTAGSGVWATHFVAMLAFHPGIAIGFDTGLTALSFLGAIVIAAMGFVLAFSLPDRTGRVAGGIVLGLAIVVMHYTGLRGMAVAGSLVWNASLVLWSIVFATGFSVAAFVTLQDGAARHQRVGAAALFTLAIVLLHSTGMGAITFLPDPRKILPRGLMSGDPLGYVVAVVTLIVVGSALAARTIDARVRRESELRFRFLARHDLLTGLPNRLLLEEVAERELTAAAASQRSAAMLCLDLDGFKEVNDSFGHAAGDSLLVEVARRLQSLVGERWLAARLGGDEFALLVSGLGPTTTASLAAQRVVEAIGAAYRIDGNTVHVTCSVGISLFPADGTTYPVLLNRADIALSRAKADGGGVFRYFEPAMDKAMRERRRLGRDLRSALHSPQIRLEYQPQVDLEQDRVSGFEALARWDHPTRGSISPGTFIPIAEETGIILQLGEWVLREACREAASWEVPLVVAVNLSVAQFRQADVAELVGRILQETGLPPHRLEIEITESLFFGSIPRALQGLQRIKELGVRIAMDDFGTGYSSLSTLQSFPFDKIKIDRSFTAQIGCAEKGTAIVKAILGLGESLGMKVVAEGVETPAQIAFLRRHHCGEVQGYLCGRPHPVSHYRELVSHPASPEPAQQAASLSWA